MSNEKSIIEQIRELPPDKYKQFIQSLDDETAHNILYNWEMIGRPKQLAGITGHRWWTNWLILAGRGFGKTRTGSETLRWFVERGKYSQIALVANTAGDVRDVIVEGPSGILATANPNFRPTYNPSHRKIEWPNGAVAHTYSAEAYEVLRGPQHDFAWVDELAKFARQEDVWDMLMFGLRIGQAPKCIITTTPRPTKLIKKLANDKQTLLTTGSSYENSANLAPSFIEMLKEKYEGSRIGRQEIHAVVLDDNPNALFTYDNIYNNTINNLDGITIERVVVAVDPAGSTSSGADETGIVVVGRAKGIGYVLHDGTLKGTPTQWGRVVVDLYKKFNANAVIVETNFGGDMVISTIRNIDGNVFIKPVRASKGKAIRAEPVSVLYEQNKVKHLHSKLNKLEEEMVGFDPSLGRKQRSPNRMDALVYALTDLFNLTDNEPGVC